MSTQALEIENINEDEFYLDYNKIKLEDLIIAESYKAKYGDPVQEIELLSPNFLNKVFNKPQDEFVALVKWEGVVTKLDKKCFEADLYDKSRHTTEEAEFSLEDVSEQDFELLKIGAIFYWSIGYLDRVSGQRIKSSIIKFRRLPTWNDQDLKEARKRAEDSTKNLIIE